jgi:hypothetical protein
MGHALGIFGTHGIVTIGGQSSRLGSPNSYK